MVKKLFRKKVVLLGILLSMFFSAASAFAGNPITFLNPSNNILDPGSPNTSWGGCGPFDSHCYVVPKKSNLNIPIPKNTETKKVSSNVATINNQTLISALRNLLNGGLSADILAKLKGPKGDAGLNGTSAYIPATYIAPNPSTNYGGGSLFGATDLSAQNFITTNAKITTLNVTGNTDMGGSLNVVGSSSFHGALSLENNFSQTGSNTFSTGTGAVSLNGATTVNDILNVTGRATFTKVPTLAHAFTTWPFGTSNVSDASVYINPASADADTNIFGVAVNGNIKFLVDAEGDVYANNLVLQGSVTSASNTIGTLNVTDNTTLGDAGTDTVTINANTMTFNNDTNFSLPGGVNGLSFDTDTLSIDATNHRIGIGTTAPSVKLDISGDIKISATISSGSSTASGYRSVAIGNGVTASGGSSFASGFATNASNTGTVAMGDSSVASGYGAVAIGNFNTASGAISFASGQNTIASGGRSTSMGYYTTASGDYSTAMGNNTIANSYNSFAIGRYNVGGGTAGSWVATDPLFEIGIGTGTGFLSANALTVLKNGNVGIGTTVPTSRLTITDGVAPFSASQDVFLDIKRNAANGNDSTSAVGLRLGNTSNGFSILYGGTTDRLRFVANGEEFMSIRNNEGQGTVGIGSTNPIQKLSVGQGHVMVDDNYGFGWGAWDTKFYGSSTGDYITFQTAGANRLTIGSTGNVGIGTTAPGSVLDIRSNSAPQLSIMYAADPTYYLTVGNNGIFNLGAPASNYYNFKLNGSSQMVIDRSGNVGIGTTAPTSKLTIASEDSPLELKSTTGNRFLTSDANAGFQIGDIDQMLSGTKISIDSSNGYINLLSGNVGIGTTAPGAKLDVRDGNFILTDADVAHGITTVAPTTAFAQMEIVNVTAGGLRIRGLTDGDVAPLIIHGSSGFASPTIAATILRGDKANGTGLQALAATEIVTQIQNSTSPLVTILGNGNVGIGTTAPGVNLDVIGTIRSSTQIFTSSNYNSYQYSTYYRPRVTATDTIFQNFEGTTEQMRLTSSGNVGIGTTSPLDKLHVHDGYLRFTGATGSGFKFVPSVDSSAFGIYDANDTAYRMWIDTSGKIGLGTQSPGSVLSVVGSASIGTNYATTAAPSNGMIIEGNVGIGTTSPGQALDVLGKVAIASDGTILWGNAKDSGKLTWDTGKAIVRGQSGQALSLGANGVQDYLYIKTDGNVGIGTTGPAGKLHVETTTAEHLITYFRNPAGYNNMISFGTTVPTNTWSIGKDNSEHFQIIEGSYAGTSRLTILDGGNVGIGTTAPNIALDVVGSIGLTGSLLWRLNNTTAYTNAAYPSIYASNGSGAAYPFTGTAGNLVLEPRLNGATRDVVIMGASAVPVAVFQGSGNVGIGTTAPGQKLHVQGAITSGTLSDGIILSYGTGVGQILGVDSGYNGWNALDIRSTSATQLYLATTGNVGIGTTAPAAKLDVYKATTGTALRVVGSAGGTSQDTSIDLALLNSVTANYGRIGIQALNGATGVETGDMYFSTVYLGTLYERMRITTAGNVGIGTTSPIGQFNLYKNNTDDGSPNLRIENAGTGDASLSFVSTSVLGWTMGLDNSDSDKFKIGTNANLGSQNILTIDSSGNVGIGTTVPNYPLDVNAAYGVIEITSTTTTNPVWLKMVGGYASYVGAEGSVAGTMMTDSLAYATFLNAFGNNALQLGTNNTARVTVLNTGNVGIGTVSPGAKLTVSVASESVVPSLGASSTFLNIAGSNAYGIIAGVLGSGKTYIQSQRIDGTATAYDMLIQPNGGNVGIGTTAPAQLLHVAGTARIDNTLYLNNNAHYINANEFYVNKTTANGGFAFNNVGAGELIFRTNNAEQMRISATGNVGIGTTSPGQKLDITNGNIKINDGYWMGASVYNSWGLNSSGVTLANSSADMYFNIDSDASSTDRSFIFAKDRTLSSGGTELMRITETGNIGIGTTAPESPLHIVGTGGSLNRENFLYATVSDAPAYSMLAVGNSTANNSMFEPVFSGSQETVNRASLIFNGLVNTSLDSGTVPVVFYTAKAYTNGNHPFATQTYLPIANKPLFAWQNFSTTVMQISANGNVGIGTTSPTHKFVIEQTSVAPIWQKIKGYDGQISGLMMGETEGTGGVINRGFDVYHDGASNLFKIDAHNNADSGTNVLTITRDSGNVGIGTTAPTAKLTIIDTSGSVGIDLGYTAGTTAKIVGFNGSAYNDLDIRATGTSGSGVYIKTTGNVGIGTTAPTHTLNVAGDLQVGTGFNFVPSANLDLALGSGSENSRFLIGQDNSNFGTIMWNYNATPANAYLSFSGYQNIPDMVILQSGNVGIGTTAPTSKLQLNKTANDTLSLANSVFYFGDETLDVGLIGQQKLSNPFAFSLQVANKAMNALYPLLLNPNGGNVGIGTTSPGYKLHAITSESTDANNVATNSGFALTTSTETHGIYARLKGNSAGISGSTYANQIFSNNGNALEIYNVNNLPLAFGVAATEYMRINSGGNVGIGTTAPAKNFHVSGESRFDSTINIGNGEGAITSATTPARMVVRGQSSRGLSLGSNGVNDYMYIDTSGNVGIGTTAPGYALDVTSGTINANVYRVAGIALASKVSASQIQIGSASTYDLSFYSGAVDRMFIQNSTGNVGIGTTAPGAKLDVNGGAIFAGNILPSAATTWNLGASGTQWGHIYTYNETVSNQLNLPGSGIWNSSGNVGIGTTAPGSKIEVVDIGNTNPYSGILNIWTNNKSQGVGVGYSGITKLSSTTNDSLYLNAKGSGNLILQTQSTGNVGIGTTAPLALLDVVGSNPKIRLGQTGNTDVPYLQTDSSNSFQFGTVGGGERMRITSIGNVGIGTTAPLNKLTVYGTGALGDIRTGYSDASSWSIGRDNETTGDFVFVDGTTAGNEKMRIQHTTGNVGIGTTAPGAKLTAYSSASANANGQEVLRLDSITSSGVVGSGPAFTFYDGAVQIGGVRSYIENSNSVGMAFSTFNTTNTTKMFISGSGNVGIGTTAPTWKLAVNGTAGFGTSTDGIVVRSGTGYGSITGQDIDDSAYNDLYLLTGSPVTPVGMVIKTGTGNVGIGTTAPTSKLTITKLENETIAFANDVLLLEGSSSTNNRWGFRIDTSGNLSLDSIYSAVEGSKMFFNRNGNVGIGTTAPGEKLEVNGNILINVATPSLKFNSTIGNEAAIRIQANSLNRWVFGKDNGAESGSNAGADFRMWRYADDGTFLGNPILISRATGKLTLANELIVSGTGNTTIAGNVGIGTTSPVQKLHVAGHCVTSDTLLPIRRRRKKKNGEEENETSGNIRQEPNSENDSGWEYLMVPIIDIKEGDEVLSLNKNKGLVEYHKINALMDMGVKDVYELKTKSGRVIRTTSTHPYLVQITCLSGSQANEKIGQNKESVVKKFINFGRKYITDSNDLS